MKKRIEITPKTLLIFFGLAIGLVLIWLTRDILTVLFIALIIIATLSPIVDWLEKYFHFRIFAVLVIYVLILSLLTIFFAALVPALIDQTQDVILNLPQYTDQISWLKGIGDKISEQLVRDGFSIRNLANYVSQSTQQVFRITGSVFGFFGAILVIIVISFYGLLSKNHIKDDLKKYLKDRKAERYWQVGHKIYRRLGTWLRAQILLAIIIGLIIGIGLWALSIPYALLLAVLAGLLELIPVLGPVIASIPAIILGFAISPFIGLLVLALFIIVHQIESYILVPKVMEKALGLSPVLILSALLIGGKLGGVIGALIAIPVASALTILILEIPNKS